MLFKSKPPPKPLAYTANTFALLYDDVTLFFRLSIIWPITAGLLSIVLPFSPFPSGELDELYPSYRNLWAIGIHTFLCIAQAGFLISLVLLLGTPALVYFAWVVVFVWGNKWFCHIFLNGFWERKFVAGREFAKNPEDEGERWVSADEKHKGEKWVFVNGVAAGSHWMQSNLTRLSSTFRRPILGIHNPSYGIPFDVLECVIQRTFSYPTSDIRHIYSVLSSLLSQPQITKLVVIAHSQGSIEVGLVMDWLFATVPTELMRKMEVYTFGNAGSHWNNPRVGGGIGATGAGGGIKGERVVKCEHYANEGDWVARFGILNYREEGGGLVAGGPGAEQIREGEEEEEKVQRERFAGRLFLRPGRPGHQMNQHYLDYMFPMDKSLKQVIDEDEPEEPNTPVERLADELSPGSRSFMQQEIDEKMLMRDDTVVPVAATQEREVTTGPNGPIRNAARNGQSLIKESTKKGSDSVKLRVKDLSRLWQYRNGGVPEELPKGFARKTTVYLQRD